MHRRSFFGKLIGATAVATQVPSDGLALSAPPLYPTVDQPKRYRTYDYHWTGLKAHQDRTFVVGQWLAWPIRGSVEKPPYLYLNVPNFIGGVYHPGYVFDISPKQRWIDPSTSEDQIRAWILEGERYLVQLMDANWLRPNDVASVLYEFPRVFSGQPIHASL